MAQVTVAHQGHSITISSKAQMQPGSVDLTEGNWPEMAWNPDEVKSALARLEAQQFNPKRVNCQQGQNRSPTMAVLYLWWKSQQALGGAYDAVDQAYAAAQADLGTAKMQNLLGQLLGGYTPRPRRWDWNDVRALLPAAARDLLP